MLLAGLRVVEFSQLIAAPFCGLTLLDLGAEVVKVESPAGDPARTFPPWLEPDRSAFFEVFNRGKRSVVADRELALRLIASADVVVENLGRGGQAVGVSYAEAGETNPALVWCSISGWGHEAPGRAIDPSLQATMGLISITGEHDRPPVRIPVPLVDFMTGMYAAQSVIAALWQAERTGQGAFLDCAMADATATLTSTSALLAAGGHLNPRRLGSESPLVVPSAVFEAARGRSVLITCVTERHWEVLCGVLGHPEWVEDERSSDNRARRANRELVNQRIAEVVAARPAQHWVETIVAAGGICELVRDIEEAWTDPRLLERGLVSGHGPGHMPLPVVTLTGADVREGHDPAPRLGEHTAAVTRDLV